MKTVAIISVITFVLIFGGVTMIGTQLGNAVPTAPTPHLAAEDYEAAERVFADLARERDRIQRQREDLVDLQQQAAVQEKILDRSRRRLEAVIAELDAKQSVYLEERERSATHLARMYEAMKPGQAASIMAALESELVLEIMVRMKERQAARILARMDPGYAAGISTSLSAYGSDR